MKEIIFIMIDWERCRSVIQGVSGVVNVKFRMEEHTLLLWLHIPRLAATFRRLIIGQLESIDLSSLKVLIRRFSSCTVCPDASQMNAIRKTSEECACSQLETLSQGYWEKNLRSVIIILSLVLDLQGVVITSLDQ